MANLPALRRTAAPKQGTTHWSRIARLPAREREKSAERTAPPDSLQTHRKLYQAVKHALETHTGKAITTADGQLLSGIVLGLLARHKENALSALNPDDPELEKKLRRIWTTWGIQKLAPTNAKGANKKSRLPDTVRRKLVAAARKALLTDAARLRVGRERQRGAMPAGQTPKISADHAKAMRFRLEMTRKTRARLNRTA